MISVIVPIYNVSQYVRQCIESICNQTYADLEIILVDDGSTDECPQICDEYRKADPRIVVIHKENGGLVSARKAGLSIAKGEYIIYVDGDDWIEPDMYQRLYQKVTEFQPDIVMCGRYEDTGDMSKKVLPGIAEGFYDKSAMVQSVYPHILSRLDYVITLSLCDKLIRKDLLTDIQLSIDERISMGEDAACIFPILLKAKSIYFSQECFYHYRQTTGSIIKKSVDPRIEKEKFSVLYRTVLEKLSELAEIYDLRPQWTEYMLTLMVPRADVLYEDFDNLNFLFPFPAVSKGSRIVLYGAGTYGQHLYGYLKKSNLYSVVLWADRNYKELQKMGLPVEAPEEIENVDFEYIVITIMSYKTRNAVKRDLSLMHGVDKVLALNEELIMSEATKKAFQIL